MRHYINTLCFLLLLASMQANAMHVHPSPGIKQWSIGKAFNLQAHLSVQNGDHYEIVYIDGKKASELVWPIRDAFLANTKLEYAITPRLAIAASASKLLGSKMSRVTDTDWDPYLMTADPIVFSSGRAELVDLNETDVQAKYAVINLHREAIARIHFLHSLENIRLNILYGQQRKQASWRYWGGEQYYNPDGLTYDIANDQVDSFDEDTVTIRYRHKEKTPYFGAQLMICSPHYALSTYIKSSKTSEQEDLDEHRLRDAVFIDTFSNAKTIETGANLSAPLTNNLSFWANYKINRLHTVVGDTDMYDSYYGGLNLLFHFKNAAGLSYKKTAYMVGIDYKF